MYWIERQLKDDEELFKTVMQPSTMDWMNLRSTSVQQGDARTAGYFEENPINAGRDLALKKRIMQLQG